MERQIMEGYIIGARGYTPEVNKNFAEYLSVLKDLCDKPLVKNVFITCTDGLYHLHEMGKIICEECKNENKETIKNSKSDT